MRNNTILVVERDPEEAKRIVDFFRKNNFRNKIDVVQSKAEAMEYVFHIGKYSNRPDHETPGLILLDLLTDLTPHVQILKPLHFYLRTADVPIIILTSSEEQERQVDSHKLGLVGFMRRPFDFTNFIELIKQSNISL